MTCTKINICSNTYSAPDQESPFHSGLGVGGHLSPDHSPEDEALSHESPFHSGLGVGGHLSPLHVSLLGSQPSVDHESPFQSSSGLFVGVRVGEKVGYHSSPDQSPDADLTSHESPFHSGLGVGGQSSPLQESPFHSGLGVGGHSSPDHSESLDAEGAEQ